MHVRTWKYLTAACGLAITAACADDQPAARATMPTRPSAVWAAAGCDFTLMKKDARAYFVSSTDLVYDLMQQFATLNKATGPTAAADFRTKGFEMLAYVGSVAEKTTKVKTPAAGDLFVRDVVTCLGSPTAVGTFTGSLGPNGLFGVPTGSAAVVSRGSPVYGAEPRTTTTTWSGSVGGQQFLLFGYPRPYTGFTLETPAQTTAAELSTIPSGLTFDPKIRGFFCQTTTSNPKLQHKNEILQQEDANYCLGLAAGVSDKGRGVFALVRHVADWFTPRPLYATTMFAGGGSGGGLGGLSPIGPVDVNVATVKLSFTQQPSNGSINSPITPAIAVKAVTALGTPLDGLTITLTVVGNQGSFNIKPGSNVAITANGGIATFPDFQTDKAGGYTITATGSFDGATKTAPVTSNQFQVSGQQ
jgi:hypothetical protein